MRLKITYWDGFQYIEVGEVDVVANNYEEAAEDFMSNVQIEVED